MCAIQNRWLVSRTEGLGLGLGRVSLFNPDALEKLLEIPVDAKAIAVLCLGHVSKFYSRPMLELEDWANREKSQNLVFDNFWQKN